MHDPNLKQVKKEVQLALLEDIGEKDVSAELISAQAYCTAHILCREPLLLAGQAWVDVTFHSLNPDIQIQWFYPEGTWISKPSTLAQIRGKTRPILSGERTALNFLQTLSATATTTYAYVQALKKTHTKVLDTRKTLPGLRYAQKYAVRCAGGQNHRMGLFDAILIKENHIKANKTITEAVKKARLTFPQLFLEVEVETLEELVETLPLKPDRILLDNFSTAEIKEAVKLNNSYAIPLEVSGGINLSNIREIAALGVNFVSVGALTKSIQAIDLSLLVDNSTENGQYGS